MPNTEFEICSRQFDIANTHNGNITLFQQEDVKEFYDKMDNNTALTEDFIAWLGEIPETMSRTAIPLFRENQGSADYQVHPAYSNLQRTYKSVDTPHFYVLSMKLDRDDARRRRHLDYDGYAVIPFGRLFVNMPVDESLDFDQTGRLSKFTGYEVLLGLDKKLWFVFNDKSLANRQSGWYPVRCNLGLFPEEWDKRTQSKDPRNASDGHLPAASFNETIDSPEFRSAYISLKETKLSSITFPRFQREIRDTGDKSKIEGIHDIDERDVDRELGV
ncbi:hypothetical protein GGR51DRAFT_412610 [Nemania sp. FL0031]|nr:hypothetical protein GGR51DRAFT_412610 [Nemania sp. FL0031]